MGPGQALRAQGGPERYSTANSFAWSSGSLFLALACPSKACFQAGKTLRRSSADWQRWIDSINEIRLWCPKIVFTVLVMKLRAISTSFGPRVSAGGSPARSSSVGAAARASGNTDATATATATDVSFAAAESTAAMHSSRSNSPSRLAMSPPPLKELNS